MMCVQKAILILALLGAPLMAYGGIVGDAVRVECNDEDDIDDRARNRPARLTFVPMAAERGGGTTAPCTPFRYPYLDGSERDSRAQVIAMFPHRVAPARATGK